MGSKQENQLEAAKAIITGDLLLEEAMVKYNVKDKRTMKAWVKKSMPLLKASKSVSPYHSNALLDTIDELSKAGGYRSDTSHQDIIRENALLKKVIALQDLVRELEEKNKELTRYQDLLLKKASQ